MTLVEILVAMAVLALFTTMVAEIVVSYRRAYHEMEVAQPSLRSEAHALEALQRDLGSMTKLYSPSVENLKEGYRPVWGENEPVTFILLDSDGDERLVSVAYDPSTESLLRTERHPQTLMDSHRQSLGRCRGLWVQATHHGYSWLVKLRLDSPLEKRLPLQTAVRLARPEVVGE